MEFLSKNAYIQVMIQGVSFCTGAKEAFALLFANAARFAMVSMIADFFLFLGKFFVLVASTCIAALILTSPDVAETISSPIFPGLLVGINAWMLGSIFMGVYEVMIDTIFQCFCKDEEKC